MRLSPGFTRLLLVGALTLAGSSALAQTAPGATPTAGGPAAPAQDEGPSAEERLAASIRVVQQRPFLRSTRFELQLMGGLGINDVLFQHFSAVANGRFHLSERFSLGATYAHYFADEASTFSEVTDRFEVFPERALTRWYAGADFAWIPIFGKYALFDEAVVHFDLYTIVGGGVTRTSKSDDLKPTGTIGVGWRLITTRWLAFVVELRDHIYVEKYNQREELVNNVVGQVGLSFWLPWDFDYRYPR